jgi:hypothetical protein
MGGDNMTEAVQKLADELEEYGSSRADFRNVSATLNLIERVK